MQNITHDDYANAIRFLSIDAVERAKSGHPGMPMGAADIASVLFKDFLKFNPQNPNWINRDRFILSAGHGSMLLYSLLHLTGYKDFPIEQIKNFRQMGAKTAGHPEYGHGGGIETTTGPLGQGIATAVGIAMGGKMLNARFGDAVNYYTYVIVGDGDLMEGVSHEAIGLAGHLKLNKLIVLFDDNEITIDGSINNSFTGCNLQRFEASGWNAFRIDGHNPKEIHAAIKKAQNSDKPTLIACKTIIGKGAPNKQNSAGVHGSPLGDNEIELVRKAFNWGYAPFEIPENIKNAWLEIGKNGQKYYDEWCIKNQAKIAEINAFEKFALSSEFYDMVNDYKKMLCETAPALATRIASQKALEILNPLLPCMIGGSADLTGSNNTKTPDLSVFNGDNYGGRYVHYGIREHGMAAAMNGLALTGFIPYGGTFLVFADYNRPAIRLSALMGLGTIHVLTHDSIGLGEDGPTHQPVEHLASLRAMPNLMVMRPADAIETLECWLIAIENRKTPSCLALTRQNLPAFRNRYDIDNKCALGAYILRDAVSSHKVTLYATGSEVEIAMAAADSLEAKNIGVRIVSVPIMELFYKQSSDYQKEILKGDIRIAIEAAVKQGWEGFISDNDAFVGMNSFGASAPYKQLYEHFGITSDCVIQKVQERL